MLFACLSEKSNPVVCFRCENARVAAVFYRKGMILWLYHIGTIRRMQCVI